MHKKIELIFLFLKGSKSAHLKFGFQSIQEKAVSSFDQITLSNIERSFHLSKIYYNQYK